MRIGYAFIKRFAKDELDIDVKQYLDKRYYELFETKKKTVQIDLTYRVVKEKSEGKMDVPVLTGFRDLQFALLDLAM